MPPEVPSLVAALVAMEVDERSFVMVDRCMAVVEIHPSVHMYGFGHSWTFATTCDCHERTSIGSLMEDVTSQTLLQTSQWYVGLNGLWC